MTGSTDALVAFNALPPDEAERELLTCCAAPGWARSVAAGRPYPDIQRVVDSSTVALAEAPWPDILAALAAHPRIGAAPTGDGREAGWSRAEQGRVSGSAELLRINEEYEARFGFLYLVFASGRDGDELIEIAKSRLTNDVDTEHAVVRGELAKIAALRLTRLLS